MFTTAAQLLDLTDSQSAPNPRACAPSLTQNPAEKLLLVLRDGRKLIGVLRSWDQFGMARTRSCSGSRTETGAWETANLMLQETVERIYTKNVYADIQRGIYIVRGENVLLLGEIVRCSLVLLAVNHRLLTILRCLRISIKTTTSLNLTAKPAQKKSTSYT